MNTTSTTRPSDEDPAITPPVRIEFDYVTVDLDAWLADRTAGTHTALTEALSALDSYCAQPGIWLHNRGIIIEAFITVRLGDIHDGASEHASTLNGESALSEDISFWLYTDPDHGPIAFVAITDNYGVLETPTAYVDAATDAGDWWSWRDYRLYCTSCGFEHHTAERGSDAEYFTHAERDDDDHRVTACPDCSAHSRGDTDIGNYGYAAHCPRCNTHLIATR